MSERERIARIVDPGAWEDWDNLSTDTSGTVGVDWHKFARNRVAPSLAKADAILARPEPSEAVVGELRAMIDVMELEHARNCAGRVCDCDLEDTRAHRVRSARAAIAAYEAERSTP